MDRGTIVIVEGPRGVGKTPIVESLVMSNFKKYKCLFLPPSLGEYDGFIKWDNDEQSYAEMIAISNLYNFGINIVMDRGIMSWCAYNCDAEETKRRLDIWFDILSQWRCPIVVCLDSDDKEIEKNIIKKNDGVTNLSHQAKFREMYKLVPDDMKVYYKVENYNNNWIFDVECKISQRMFGANAFHNIKRFKKRILL